MKAKIILWIGALLLLTAGAGCEKKRLINYIDINVVYQKCNSSVDYPIKGEIKKEDILLFNSIYTKESEIIKRYSQNKEIEYIIYNPNSISKNYWLYVDLSG